MKVLNQDIPIQKEKLKHANSLSPWMRVKTTKILFSQKGFSPIALMVGILVVFTSLIFIRAGLGIPSKDSKTITADFPKEHNQSVTPTPFEVAKIEPTPQPEEKENELNANNDDNDDYEGDDWEG